VLTFSRFEKRYMKYGMDLSTRGQLQTISYFTDAFQHRERTKVFETPLLILSKMN
jgi:hypothetical protein